MHRGKQYLKSEQFGEKVRKYRKMRRENLKEINKDISQRFFNEISISDLEFPYYEKTARTRLLRRGIKTLADVLEKSEEELRNIPGIGDCVIYELKTALSKYHLDLIHKY